jgi:hypothetical protein
MIPNIDTNSKLSSLGFNCVYILSDGSNAGYKQTTSHAIEASLNHPMFNMQLFHGNNVECYDNAHIVNAAIPYCKCTQCHF